MENIEMTTIIVVAIVALVFFVTISVVAFMTWKQETERRTDSLKGIEDSLNDVLLELYGKNNVKHSIQDDFYDEFEDNSHPTYKYGGTKVKKDKGRTNKTKRDPFKWMRTEKDDDDVIVFKPNKKHVNKLRWTEVTEDDFSTEAQNEDFNSINTECVSNAEENFDMAELGFLEDVEFFRTLEEKHTEHNVGRSGKKYTAEELEELIKE